MNVPLSMDQVFINKITGIVLANLGDEELCAEKLSKEAGMSRSSLNRRLRSIKNQDISQFIREIRLKKAMLMLQNNEGTAAEIAFRVGFGSPTYFNKCFHDYYGYPPGEFRRKKSVSPWEEKPGEPNQPGSGQHLLPKNSEVIREPKRTLFVIGSGILVICILLILIFEIFNFSHKDTNEDIIGEDGKISVVVLPFQDMTYGANRDYWGIWIQNEIRASLSSFRDILSVRMEESTNSVIKSVGSINNASITPTVAWIIAKRLDANVFITGMLKITGNEVKLTALIHNTKTNEVLQPFEKKGPYIDEYSILPILDTLRKEIANFLRVSVLKMNLSPLAAQDLSSQNPEAIEIYMTGRQSRDRGDVSTAIEYFKRAYAIDSNFSTAARNVSRLYFYNDSIKQAKEWCNKIYRKRDQMSDDERIRIKWLHAQIFETLNDELKVLKELVENDDQHPDNHLYLSQAYRMLGQNDNSVKEAEKALELYKYQELDSNFSFYVNLGYAYLKAGQIRKANKLYKHAEKDIPDNQWIIRFKAVLSLTEGKRRESEEYIEKYLSFIKKDYPSAVDLELANIYDEVNLLDKAEEHYQKYCESEPDNPDRMNSLAYFLIYRDRDIPKGMQLINKALLLSPDNYNYLDTKGWGLYKLGKYQEAYDILQRSWELRMKYSKYNHLAFLHREEARLAIEGKGIN